MNRLPGKLIRYEYHWQVMQQVVFDNQVKTMAEVGVLFGDFAKHLMRYVERYIMVDPWARYPDEWREADSLSHFDQSWWDECYESAMHATERWADKRTVYRMSSVEAAENIQDESLDLVFIDALHHYEPMLQDIEAWFPKVKPDGIFSGHDWWDNGTDYAQTMEGVRRALLDTFPARIIHFSPWWDHVWIVFKEELP